MIKHYVIKYKILSKRDKREEPREWSYLDRVVNASGYRANIKSRSVHKWHKVAQTTCPSMIKHVHSGNGKKDDR